MAQIGCVRHLSHRLYVTLVSLKTWKEISTSREQFTQEESKLYDFYLEVPFFSMAYILL